MAGLWAWWLAQESALDEKLVHEEFEAAELNFVERMLRPGMTVVDAGAYHGLYTLLASKRVGRTGRVIAFEPSARERTRLLKHIRLNRCTNVVVQSFALGEQNGQADLYVVDGRQDWCYSLRPPAVAEQTKASRVEVRRVDEALAALGVRQVDLIKLDVEGMRRARSLTSSRAATTAGSRSKRQASCRQRRQILRCMTRTWWRSPKSALMNS